MTSKLNQRAKRKNEFFDENSEPNMKALKKEDIIAHFRALQANFKILENKNQVLEKKNIKLEDENKVHKEAINLLEETVKILEKKVNHNKIDKRTTESQTDVPNLQEGANTPVYLCEDCDYLAECIHDFNDHTHSSDSLENLNMSPFTCNFCDENFETLQEVMKHKKINHTSSVQHCNQFLENICFYGDSCWFLHSESYRKSEPSFKCNFCDKKFRTQNILREHMKQLHTQFVSNCKNDVDCKFGPRKCWFLHQEDIKIAYENAKNEHQSNDNDMNFDME